MDFFDILLVKKLLSKISSGEDAGPEIQEIIKQLEEKVSRDEMQASIESSIANLPTLSQDDLLNILK